LTPADFGHILTVDGDETASVLDRLGNMGSVPLSQTTPQLGGQYTVIGQLVDGWEVLDSIEKTKTGSDDRPLTPIVMEQVFVTTE
jgi:cyclophilin family peptidyl-prolyl cis-trans isomerase